MLETLLSTLIKVLMSPEWSKGQFIGVSITLGTSLFPLFSAATSGHGYFCSLWASLVVTYSRIANH